MILYFVKNKINGGYKPKNKGFFVLTMTLIVLVTVLTIATGIFLRSIDDLNQTSDSEKSLTAWSTVNSCGEFALGQIATTTNGLAGWSYTGNQFLRIGDNTCYIYNVEPFYAVNTDCINLSKRCIRASSTVSTFTRKIIIEVSTNTPRIIVNSWNAVADF